MRGMQGLRCTRGNRYHEGMTDDETLLRPGEAAALLSISTDTLIRWGNLGRIRYTQRHAWSRERRYHRAEVERVLAEKTENAGADKAQVIPNRIWTLSNRWPKLWVYHDATGPARITWHADGTWTSHTSANWRFETRDVAEETSDA